MSLLPASGGARDIQGKFTQFSIRKTIYHKWTPIDRQLILTSRAKCTTLQEGSKALVTGISSIRTTLGSHYAIYVEPMVVRAQPTEQSQLAFPNPRGAWTWLCS
jgi:hypothetical protein